MEDEKKLVSKRIVNMITADEILLSCTIEYTYSNGEVVRKDYVKPEDQVKREYKEHKKKKKALKKALMNKADDDIFEDTLDIMEMLDI